MTILINLYNQLGAGPKNISLNLIGEAMQTNHQEIVRQSSIQTVILVPNVEEYASLITTSTVLILKLPKYNHLFMKVIYRFFLDVVYIPLLVNRYQTTNLLAFGNYLLSPVFTRKTVLLHHPYLFDDKLLKTLNRVSQLIERFKRSIFGLTLRNVHTVVVQSNYVLQMFKQKWPNFKGNVVIIPNPISNSFKQQTATQIESLISSRLEMIATKVQILFVSRFYPHKNHEFLIALSQALLSAKVTHSILVTINPNLAGAADFLNEIQTKKLPIINLSELPQTELNKHYANSHLFLFPSRSETFGNPLIEAMSYGLPMVLPRLEYAQSVVGNAGIYYTENNAKHCAEYIAGLVHNLNLYQQKSMASHQQFNYYPNVQVWFKQYMQLCSCPN